jgi:DNA-binding transcriptional regulator YiaG
MSGEGNAGLNTHDMHRPSGTAYEAPLATRPVSGGLQPAECRAGRALLGWSQQELAARSGFPALTIDDFEEGRRVLSLSARVALHRVFRKGLLKAGR